MKRKLGFRFRPNEEQLINHYLKGMVLGLLSVVDKQSIAFIPNFLKFEPWDLPAFSKEISKDRFWYFFYQLDYKYRNSKRADRKTEAGFWKITGTDSKIWSNKKQIGIKKTLVFYEGCVSKNKRTNWVLHEYHITVTTELPNPEAYVICHLEEKADVKGRKRKASTLTLDEVESSHQSSCQSRSDFGNRVAEVDPPPQATSRAITDCDELDFDISELKTLLNTEQGRSLLLNTEQGLSLLLNPEQGLSLQDLQSPNSFNSDYNEVQTQSGTTELPSSNSLSSKFNGVQTQSGTTKPPLSNSFSSDRNGFQIHSGTIEPPSSNSFSSYYCNGVQTQSGTTEPGEEFAFSDSLLADECNTYPGETSSHKNSVESEGLNLNWDVGGMSFAAQLLGVSTQLLESLGGTSYDGGMIGNTNHEVAIQASEAVGYVTDLWSC